METDPWSIVADIADEQRGVREGLKANQSPDILRYWAESGIGRWGHDDQLPWCATFVSWCIRRATRLNPRLVAARGLMTPSVSVWLSRAPGVGCHRVPWQHASRGSVVVFLPHFSHIGIVSSVAADGLWTVEGNTNSNGSREGDGVYERFRPSAIIGSVWRLPVAR